MSSTLELGLMLTLVGSLIAIANFMRSIVDSAKASERKSVGTEKSVELLALKMEGEITLLKHRVLSLEGYLSKETNYQPRRIN